MSLGDLRALYLFCFEDKAAADAFERAALARPRETMPPAALAVLDGGPRTEAFYDYLFSRLHGSPDQRSAST